MTRPASVPPVLRQISVRAAMDILLQEGPTSRASLAKKTGLSKQTMSEVIRALEDAGWVKVKGIVSGKVGRSAVTYEVAEDGGYAFGIDLGATSIRLALVSMAGTIVHESEHSTESLVGDALMDRVHQLVEASLDAAAIPRNKVLLGAVATPGVVDPDTGLLTLAPNMGDLDHLDVVRRLTSATGVQVVVENDVNAAVLGESWKGCAAGFDDIAFLTLGTGIGLGMMINGKLIRGARGAAGEISYLPFGADPYQPSSLDRGALETAIGARGILERHRASGGQGSSPRDILEAAAAGEPIALATIKETARLAAMLVVSVDAMIDPQAIVLDGKIGRHPLLLRLVEDELPRLTRRSIRLEASLLASRATLVGAVAIALNQLHNALFSPQDLPSDLRLPQAGGGIDLSVSPKGPPART